MPFAKRGAFIVFEGCDRSGKTTQSQLLFQSFQNRGIPVKHLRFPARESETGKMIDAYLTGKQELSDEVVHLLFATNRWEHNKLIGDYLRGGATCIVDRYSYSGMAYSIAKGLDYDWCFAPERGLLRPDIVFYLKGATNALAKRGDYGAERYEKLDFQTKVADVFNRICEQENQKAAPYWCALDAGESVKTLAAQIIHRAEDTLDAVRDEPIAILQ